MATVFRQSLAISEQQISRLPLFEILSQFFPNLIKVEKSDIKSDQAGADYIVIQRGANDFSIDTKVRSSDPRKWGRDDLAIETWSSVEHRIVGYRAPKTDYILWLYPTTGRAILIPFRPFRRRVARKRQLILRALKQHTQRTVGKAGNIFHSQHCYVPTWLFADLIQEATFQPSHQFRKSA